LHALRNSIECGYGVEDGPTPHKVAGLSGHHLLLLDLITACWSIDPRSVASGVDSP
jgi:hypothetical protein